MNKLSALSQMIKVTDTIHINPRRPLADTDPFGYQ